VSQNLRRDYNLVFVVLKEYMDVWLISICKHNRFKGLCQSRKWFSTSCFLHTASLRFFKTSTITTPNINTATRWTQTLNFQISARIWSRLVSSMLAVKVWDNYLQRAYALNSRAYMYVYVQRLIVCTVHCTLPTCELLLYCIIRTIIRGSGPIKPFAQS